MTDGTGRLARAIVSGCGTLFRAIALLLERNDATTMQSWFTGGTPALDDEAPAHVLREGDPLEGARDVIAAAKTFAHIG